MPDAPQWVVNILDVLPGCIQCYTPGSLDIQFAADDAQLTLAPAMTVVIGEGEDPDQGFPFFSLHLAELSEMFDSAPQIWWDTMHDELHVEGAIGCEDAWITFRKFPFDDDETP